MTKSRIDCKAFKKYAPSMPDERGQQMKLEIGNARSASEALATFIGNPYND